MKERRRSNKIGPVIKKVSRTIDRKASAFFTKETFSKLPKQNEQVQYSIFNTALSSLPPFNIVNSKNNVYHIPHIIEGCMIWLRVHALEVSGLFRKSGLRSRISALRSGCDAASKQLLDLDKKVEFQPLEYVVNALHFFEQVEGQVPDLQVADCADFLKQWFRALPEPLIPLEICEKISKLFEVPMRTSISRIAQQPDSRLEIFKQYEVKRNLSGPFLAEEKSFSSPRDQNPVRNELQLAVQSVLVLLPDEHRILLKMLLMLLKDTAQYSKVNQMTVENLAVCWSPSLFPIEKIIIPVQSRSSTNIIDKFRKKTKSFDVDQASSIKSSKSFSKIDSQHSIDTLELNNKLVEFLGYLIENHETLFTVPAELNQL